MGIPVVSKRNNKMQSPLMPSGPGSIMPYDPRMPPRGHYKRSDGGDVLENEVPAPQVPLHPEDQFKRGNSDMSRMGNYFNIVIAPPPIKAMQPRKVLSNDYRAPAKRYSS